MLVFEFSIVYRSIGTSYCTLMKLAPPIESELCLEFVYEFDWCQLPTVMRDDNDHGWAHETVHL